MRVDWLAQATTDAGRIVDHISVHNPLAAKRIGRELLTAADSLALFPKRGRLGQLPGTRELWTTGPYVLVYRVTPPDTVRILRVWHAAQDRPTRS